MSHSQQEEMHGRNLSCRLLDMELTMKKDQCVGILLPLLIGSWIRGWRPEGGLLRLLGPGSGKK